MLWFWGEKMGKGSSKEVAFGVWTFWVVFGGIRLFLGGLFLGTSVLRIELCPWNHAGLRVA